MMEEMMKRWAREYNTPSFIDCDPIKFPRKYMERQDDAEISGLLTIHISRKPICFNNWMNTFHLLYILFVYYRNY